MGGEEQLGPGYDPRTSITLHFGRSALESSVNVP